MAQQINLYTPILLKPRRHFSARKMALALGLLAVLLIVFCAGVLQLQAQRGQAFTELQARQAAERQQLTDALQRARLQHDPTALSQQLRSLQTELPLLRAQRAQQAALELPAGRHHSDTLALVARTVPASVWVSQLQLQADHLVIQGMTLDPAALQAWIPLLEAGATPGGQRLAQVRVEQWGARQPGQATLLPAASSGPNVPAWSFRVATPGAPDAAGTAVELTR